LKNTKIKKDYFQEVIFLFIYLLIIFGVSLKNTAKNITIKVPISKNV
jgi:hypothetical protein